jgi:hypothetical protein
VKEILEPKFDNQQALPYGGESGRTRGAKGLYNDSDVLSFMRTRRAGQNVPSSGVLYLAGKVEAAYECSCGFRGVFIDTHCARCGKELMPQ